MEEFRRGRLQEILDTHGLRATVSPGDADNDLNFALEVNHDGRSWLSLRWPLKAISQEGRHVLGEFDLGARLNMPDKDVGVHRMSQLAHVVAVHADLFGFDPDTVDWQLYHYDSSPSPSGVTTEHLIVHQRLGNLDVLDGEITFVLVDGALASFSGRPVLKSDLVAVPPDLLEIEAVAAGQNRTRIDEGKAPLAFRRSKLVYDPIRRLPVWQVLALTSDGGNSPKFEELLINATDGNVLLARETDAHIDSEWRHYQPSTAQFLKATAKLTTLDTHVSGSIVYPFSVPSPTKSLVATYNSTVTGIRPVGFFWEGYYFNETKSLADPDFDHSATAGSPNNPLLFASQHAHRWSVLAWNTADTNFTWWAPPAIHKNTGLTVIVDHDDPNCAPGCVLPSGNPCNCTAAAMGESGCWDWSLWSNPHEDNPCIRHSADHGSSYGIGQAAPIDVVFHEVGHAVDWKYLSGILRKGTWYTGGTCTFNTSDEGKSLGEAIASMYGLMVILQEFRQAVSMPWTEYLHHPSLHTELLQGTAGYTIHNGPGTRSCHGFVVNAGLPVECDLGRYRYAAPLVQAFWEVSHGKDCYWTPCTNLGGTTNSFDLARWALFYAMKHTPNNGTYRQFVSNFLDYIYYNHKSSWASRWLVFSDYNLVGTLFASAAECY